MEGFTYSAALKSKQIPWTDDELYEWLKKCRASGEGALATTQPAHPLPQDEVAIAPTRIVAPSISKQRDTPRMSLTSRSEEATSGYAAVRSPHLF
jgi:hypothetical protein